MNGGPAMASPLGRLAERVSAWDPHRHPWWLRALVAVVITVLAAWMRAALAPAESGGRFITLSLAAALCALYGGFRIGMLSTLLGMVVVNFLLVKPYFSFAIDDLEEAFWLNLWHLVTQIVVVGAIALMQRQHRQLQTSIGLAAQSQRQLLDTFEHSATGMAHSRVDGSWIRINQTYCDLIGYSRQELLNHHWRDYTHPDDLELDLGHMQRMLRGEIDHYTIEKRYIHRDGHTVWVVLSVTLMRLPDGAPDYMIVVVQDITERKAVEDALRTSERLLGQAQLLVGMATWRFDAATRTFVTLANSHQVLGLPASRFTDLEMLAHTHPDDTARVKQAWADAIMGIRPYDIEYRLRFGEQWRWFSVRAEFERDARGRATMGLGVVHDITRRKEAALRIHELNNSLEQRIQERTQALKAAYDELESYSYAVAHDLRSPLRIINGFAQALEEDNPALDAESLRHLNRIRDASKKMGELIDGLLKLSQMARGDLHREPVDLSAMATRQLRELAAGDPQRAVDWQVEPGLLAMADPPLIEALLQNLLHNAWKYSARAPVARIRVDSFEEAQRRWYRVTDNGAGFDMARARDLFQPFRRMHPTAQFEGSGVGLSLVQRIVQHHGGEVRLRSQLGVGTVAEFTLDPLR